MLDRYTGVDRHVKAPQGAFVLDPFAHLKSNGGLVNVEAHLGQGVVETPTFQPLSAKHRVHRPGVVSDRWDAELPVMREQGATPLRLLPDYSAKAVREQEVEQKGGQTGEALPVTLQLLGTWIEGLVVDRGDEGDQSRVKALAQSGHELMTKLNKEAIAMYLYSVLRDAKTKAEKDEVFKKSVQKLRVEAGIRIRTEITAALDLVRNNLVHYELTSEERNVVIGAANVSDDIRYFEDALRNAKAEYARLGSVQVSVASTSSSKAWSGEIDSMHVNADQLPLQNARVADTYSPGDHSEDGFFLGLDDELVSTATAHSTGSRASAVAAEKVDSILPEVVRDVASFKFLGAPTGEAALAAFVEAYMALALSRKSLTSNDETVKAHDSFIDTFRGDPQAAIAHIRSQLEAQRTRLVDDPGSARMVVQLDKAIAACTPSAGEILGRVYVPIIRQYDEAKARSSATGTSRNIAEKRTEGAGDDWPDMRRVATLSLSALTLLVASTALAQQLYARFTSQNFVAERAQGVVRARPLPQPALAQPIETGVGEEEVVEQGAHVVIPESLRDPRYAGDSINEPTVVEIIAHMQAGDTVQVDQHRYEMGDDGMLWGVQENRKD